MQLHDWPTLSFFTQPAAMTSAGRYARPLDPLPRDVAGLTAVAQGLLVHEHIASEYGVTLSDEDRDSVHIRPVERLLERLLERITARDRWRQIRDRRESSLPGRTVDSAAARRSRGRRGRLPVLYLGG